MLIFFLITVIYIAFHGFIDLSILRSPIINVITFLQVYLIIIIFNNYLKIDTIDILRAIIITFSIQSVIQLLAFSSELIYDYVVFFQNIEDSILMKEGYGGLRGLALAGELSFTLSASYGLIFIVQALKISILKKIEKFDIITFILIFAGAMFAGRTAYVGLIFAYLYLLIWSVRNIKYLPHIFFLKMFIVILVILLLESELSQLAILKFAFEAYYNFKNLGSLSTESTDILINYHLPAALSASFSTILVGDGIYINADGEYYMNTDSGYLRNIFFGGVFFLLFKFFVQGVVSFGWILSKHGLNYFSEYLLFNIFVFLYFCILHIKGDSLINLKFCLVIILLINASVVSPPKFRHSQK